MRFLGPSEGMKGVGRGLFGQPLALDSGNCVRECTNLVWTMVADDELRDVLGEDVRVKKRGFEVCKEESDEERRKDVMME